MTKVRGSFGWIIHAVGIGAVAVGGTARVTTEVTAVVGEWESGSERFGCEWRKKKKKRKRIL